MAGTNIDFVEILSREALYRVGMEELEKTLKVLKKEMQKARNAARPAETGSIPWPDGTSQEYEEEKAPHGTDAREVLEFLKQSNGVVDNVGKAYHNVLSQIHQEIVQTLNDIKAKHGKKIFEARHSKQLQRVLDQHPNWKNAQMAMQELANKMDTWAGSHMPGNGTQETLAQVKKKIGGTTWKKGPLQTKKARDLSRNIGFAQDVGKIRTVCKVGGSIGTLVPIFVGAGTVYTAWQENQEKMEQLNEEIRKLDEEYGKLLGQATRLKKQIKQLENSPEAALKKEQLKKVENDMDRNRKARDAKQKEISKLPDELRNIAGEEFVGVSLGLAGGELGVVLGGVLLSIVVSGGTTVPLYVAIVVIALCGWGMGELFEETGRKLYTKPWSMGEGLTVVFW